MSIHVGAAGVKGVFVGGVSAKSVYLGTQQVWTAKKPVQFKGSTSAMATSLALPAHQAGDLILMWAWRGGITTPPSQPGGWTQITANTGNTAGGISNASRLSYMVATSSNHVSGNWSGAWALMCSVFTGQGAQPIGGASEVGGRAASIPVPAITLADPSGDSQVVSFYGSSNTATTTLSTPVGYTERDSIIYQLGGEFDVWKMWTKDDTKTGPKEQISVNTTVTYRVASVEIRA